jgi:GTP-binding protein EngB required for normal cell division
MDSFIRHLQKAKMLSLLCCETYENETKLISDQFKSSLRYPEIIKHSDPTVPLLALSGILDRELIIAFRGTVIANKEQPLKSSQEMLLNMICNGLAVADNPNYPNIYNTSFYAGVVHPGFALLLEEFLPYIKTVIEKTNPKSICLTGHSLGGALATLAAYRLMNAFSIDSVYTFGSPRVGDKDFRDQYSIRHFRFENKNDIVPHLPPFDKHRDWINNLISPFNLSLPAVSYKHVGKLQFINWEGKLVKDSRYLQQERLNKFVKNPNKIFNDHNISLYSQSLEKLIKQIANYPKKIGVNMETSLNILTIGKTGTGKSSLINYLYGANIAKTGVGRPVTQGGFDKYKINWQNTNVEIYDSVGLEVGYKQSQEWRKSLQDELKKHGIELEAKDWFHAVLYCINAGGHRIEPYEDEIIQQLISEKYRIVIVITNSDKLTDEEISELVEPITQKFAPDDAPIVPVCSIQKKLRDNSIIRPFGREELEEQILKGFWYAITIRLPERCEYLLHKEVDNWIEKQIKFINSYISNNKLIISRQEMVDSINTEIEKFQQELGNLIEEILLREINETVNNFRVLANKLQYQQQKDIPSLPDEIFISQNFIGIVKSLLQSFENFFTDVLAKIVSFFDYGNPNNIITKLEQEVGPKFKKIITEQKPEISGSIKKMIIKKTKLQ